MKLFWSLVIGGAVWGIAALSNPNSREALMDLPGRSAMDAYVAEGNRLVDRYNVALGELTRLNYRPKWGRDDWVGQVAEQYTAVVAVHEGWAALTPPDDVAEAHAAQVKAMAICKDWAEQSRQAVIDETYNKWLEIQETLGGQCDEANNAVEVLYSEAGFIIEPKPTTVPSPTLKPTRTPTPTITPTLGEPARSPQGSED
jgi:hypothetical protein